MLSLIVICQLFGLAILGAAAQLCFKYGSVRSEGHGLLKIAFNPWVLLGIACMVLNVLAFTWILRRVPLTSAMPFAALVYILVPVGARCLFFESLLPRFWGGVSLIGIGIILTVL